MQHLSDDGVSPHLEAPSCPPLSRLRQLLLPRDWMFSLPHAGPDLPDDPIVFLESVIVDHAAAHGQLQDSTALGRSSDADTSLSKSDLVELSIQTWRLQRRVEGMDPEKHSREYKQFSDSVRRFSKILNRLDVEFEDPTNRPYTTGWLEVEVVSWDEPGDEVSPVPAGPWVKKTISPIVRQHGTTIKAGQVICVDVEE